METAERIKILRMLNGFTQEAVAAILGAPRPSIVVWESGKHPPAQQYVVRLAELVGVEPGYILFGRPQISYGALIPSSPGRPQNYAPYLRDISALLPSFLQENELDSVRYSRLGNGGTMYLLGRKNAFSVMLLVCESLVSCFGNILEKDGSVEMGTFDNFTVETFSEKELKFLSTHACDFTIDYKAISMALSQRRREKYTVASLMTAFGLALQQFEPLDIDDMAKFGSFFEKTANSNIPLSDINPIAMTREAEDFLVSINGKKRATRQR